MDKVLYCLFEENHTDHQIDRFVLLAMSFLNKRDDLYLVVIKPTDNIYLGYNVEWKNSTQI